MTYTIARAWLLGRAAGRRASPDATDWLARALAALAAGLASGWALRSLIPLPAGTTADLLLRTALHGGGGALVLLACARLLGVREARRVPALRQSTG